MNRIILKGLELSALIYFLFPIAGNIFAQSREIVLTKDSAYYKGDVNRTPPSRFTPIDVMPEPLQRFNPLYPPEAFKDKIEGIVFVDCWLTSEGSVRQATVLKSSNAIFNKSALECSLKWIFKPAMKDGHAVEVLASLPIRFTILNTSPDGFVLQNVSPKNPEPKSPAVFVKHDTLTYPISAVLPSGASFALDEKLQGWKIAKLSEDSLNPMYNSFFKCDLNKDNNPDYVLVVVTGNKSTLTEHYVAIVSTGDKYNAFILRSYNISKCWIDDFCLLIHPKNTYVPIIGDLDSSVPYKNAPNESSILFDVDSFTIDSIIGNYCISYVYHNNIFYEFSSCE